MGNLDKLPLQVPDSCCKSPSPGCGARDHPSNIAYTGCSVRCSGHVSRVPCHVSRVPCHVSVVPFYINRIAEVLSEDLQLVTLVSCVVRCDGRSHCVLTPALCRRVSCRWWAWCSPPASSLAPAARWPEPGRGRRRGRRRWL